MFNNSKYTRIYFNIINFAKRRNSDFLGEIHHIIPVSCGGSNIDSNLVKLTYREHYICHLLLTKMSTGKEKNSLMFALWAMSNQNGIYRMERNYKINSKIYEKLRKEIPILLKETNKGRKYTNRKSPTYTNEQKEKMKERMIELNKKRAGRKITEETKQKLRIAALKQKKIFGRNHTEETKEKIKNARAKQTNVKNQYTKNQSSPK